MLFNSIEYAIFLAVLFFLYWVLFNKNYKHQNLLLLTASYFFYGYWDWRFLFLLSGLASFNYSLGILIGKNKKYRKLFFVTGVLIDISVLAVFKYLNFFIDSFVTLSSKIGVVVNISSINIILPLGISFYIFLSLSYIIDVYQGKLRSDYNVVDVLLSLSFFPILLSGPIQRPITLLPQISKKRVFDDSKATDALRQILWGLFKKVVIADNCARVVNNIFDNYSDVSGITLIVGAIFYTIQIYGDFSGYSDIAIGSARLFGFDLNRNFAYPYFSRDITEFWRRWHISLTLWFRDYVFLPVSFSLSRKISSNKVFGISSDLIIYSTGISVTWFLTGLWHGANFTFITWGIIHGMVIFLYHILRKPRKKLFRKLNIKKNNYFVIICEWFINIVIVITAWIFFRAKDMSTAFKYIGRIITDFKLQIPKNEGIGFDNYLLLILTGYILIEWLQRHKDNALDISGLKISKPVRWLIYYSLIGFIIFYSGDQQEFIYFQF